MFLMMYNILEPSEKIRTRGNESGKDYTWVKHSPESGI
jgi:hypothetical protein